MDKILTLEQLQNMSIDDITIAYQNGYILSESESQRRTVSLQTTWTTAQYTQIILAIIGVFAAYYSGKKATEAKLSADVAVRAARGIKK